MRIRTLQGCTLLHRSIETDFAQSAQRIEAEMKLLAAEMKAAKIAPMGPPILVFHNPTPEAGKAYTVEMGFAVAQGVEAPPASNLRKLESIRAATVTFSGPVSALEGAYKDLYQQIDEAGETPAGEIRQYSLYWEGKGSPNNVFLLQVALQQ